jgi:hypothetical protein
MVLLSHGSEIEQLFLFSALRRKTLAVTLKNGSSSLNHQIWQGLSFVSTSVQRTGFRGLIRFL